MEVEGDEEVASRLESRAWKEPFELVLRGESVEDVVTVGGAAVWVMMEAGGMVRSGPVC